MEEVNGFPHGVVTVEGKSDDTGSFLKVWFDHVWNGFKSFTKGV